MTSRIKSLFMRWFPAVLIMSIIFLVSATPSADLPDFGWVDLLVKKGGHFSGYFLLGLAYQYGLGNNSQTGLWTLGFVLIYAVTDEVHQVFVPGRHPAVLDVVVDMGGALLAVWLECKYHFLYR